MSYVGEVGRMPRCRRGLNAVVHLHLGGRQGDGCPSMSRYLIDRGNSGWGRGSKEDTIEEGPEKQAVRGLVFTLLGWWWCQYREQHKR